MCAGLHSIIKYKGVIHTMVWIITALLAAIISSFVSINDSYLLSKKMPSLPVYLIPMGFTQLIGAVVLLAFFPFPTGLGVTHILAALGAGILNASGLVIMLNTLRRSEVSRVIPVISSAPIFVAILSIPLLGDTLSYWQWLAIILTVAGAVLISIHKDGSGRKPRLQKSFFILLTVAVMSAIASIGFKYAMRTLPFWNMYNINGICIGAVVLTYSLRKTNLLELKNLKQRTQKVGFVAGGQCLGIIAGIFAFKALGSGTVALVNAILNVRPAFVFLFALIISRFFPRVISEPLGKSTVLLKLAAIIMMTCGVVIIGFSR